MDSQINQSLGTEFVLVHMINDVIAFVSEPGFLDILFLSLLLFTTYLYLSKKTCFEIPVSQGTEEWLTLHCNRSTVVTVLC